MSNPDPVTRISPPPAGGPSLRLRGVPVGRSVRVTAMSDAARATLEHEGIVTGTVLKLERRVGLGGPVIVKLGRARLAIARAVAGKVEVETVEEEPG